jgi:polar amino acid transport system substrate-binding protein
VKHPLKSAAAAVAVLAALTLTGCGGSVDAAAPTQSAGSSAANLNLVTSGTLTLATTGNSEPFSYSGSDGQLTGFDVELFRELASRLHLKAEIKTYDFDAILPLIATHQVDVAMNSIADTDERRKNVDFSLPDYTGTMNLVVPKSSAITDEKGIDGKRIGVISASMGAKYAEEYYTGAQLVTFPDSGAVMTAVQAAQIDAAFIDGQEATKYEKQYPVHSVVATTDPANRGAAIVVSKQDPELRKALNEELRKALKDGTYAKLFTQYAPNEPVEPQLEFLTKYYGEHSSNEYPY